MKKTIISVFLLFALAIGFSLPAKAEGGMAIATVVATPTSMRSNIATGSLEKIPSPDQIRYFKMIKKEGGSLYGVRISKPLSASSTKITKASSTISNKIEKIASPALINLYEKIQKIGNALWGIRKGNSGSKATSTPRLITSDISTCVALAIEKKDTMLKEKIEMANLELKAAIDIRTSCQKIAISSIEKQSENIKVCVKNYQSSHAATVKKAKEAQKNVWSVYQTDLKACIVSSTSTAPIIIEDGGDNISDSLLQ